MKKLLSGLALILISVSAFATQRTPLATIPGPEGGSEPVTAVVAAQNGVLAVAYSQNGPEIYLYSIPNWTQVIATLTISDPNAIIYSVAIQNDYIAVGAADTSTQLGAVYIFAKPQGGWTSEPETATLSPSDPSAQDEFGFHVSVWGNTVLTSSALVAAYLFVEPEGGWKNATESARLAPSDAPFAFGLAVSITGAVGSGGNLAVVSGFEASPAGGGSSVAYVYVQPESGWTSTTQTAELNAGVAVCCTFEGVSAAESTIALSTGNFHGQQPPAQILIFNQPEGGWQNSSSPTFTASASNAEMFFSPSLTQNAQVLVSGYGSSYFKKGYMDLAFLWHSDEAFGSSPITLSAAGLTGSLNAATVTADYAFAWDSYGNIFVFKGN
jgi:hypothetical protein